MVDGKINISNVCLITLINAAFISINIYNYNPITIKNLTDLDLK